MIRKMHNLQKLHLRQTVLTATLRERSAEYAQNAANSANAQPVFLHFPKRSGQKLKMLQLLLLRQADFCHIYNIWQW